jgi:hypothetical protein
MARTSAFSRRGPRLSRRCVSGIAARTADVRELAKSENLGQSAEAYAKFVAGGGKPRRASAEAAFDLLDVVIERPAQAGQTLGVCGFQVQIQGGDMTAQGILSGN